MDIHKNARLSFRSRELLVQRVVERAVQLRRSYTPGYEIARCTAVSPASISRILRRARLSRWRDLHPAPPVVRYEHAAPGDLLHLDIKGLTRFQQVSWRGDGRRRGQHKHPGWQALAGGPLLVESITSPAVTWGAPRLAVSRRGRVPGPIRHVQVSQTSLLPSPFPKSHARHYAHRSEAREENDKRSVASARNLPHPKQDVAHNQIEQRPGNIHRGRRQSFPGRVSEWRREAVPRNALHEMRHCISEKHSGKETGEVVIPLHCESSCRATA